MDAVALVAYLYWQAGEATEGPKMRVALSVWNHRRLAEQVRSTSAGRPCKRLLNEKVRQDLGLPQDTPDVSLAVQARHHSGRRAVATILV